MTGFFPTRTPCQTVASATSLRRHFSISPGKKETPNFWTIRWSPFPTTEKVGNIALEAATRGQVIGLQIADTGNSDIEASPWLRPHSRIPKHLSINEPIPHEVRGVLSQQLYVEKAGLPSALINQMKRLAAFQYLVDYWDVLLVIHGPYRGFSEFVTYCFYYLNGGEGGIRTLDTGQRIHTFQACALNHSATSPASRKMPVIQGGED